MEERQRVKVTKDGLVKHIYKDELPTYLAMGWIELKDFKFDNPSYSKIK